MGRTRTYSIQLTEEDQLLLQSISRSRSEQVRRVERAKILLLHAQGLGSIAKQLDITVPAVLNCIQKAIEMGIQAALDDLPRSGKPRQITPEARTWILSVACQKPKDLGFSYELWTHRLLAKYIRDHAVEQGHPSVAQIASGTISKLLRESPAP